MVFGDCRLCGNKGSLTQSHIIPKFVFRWSKQTSGTGYFRFGQKPNKRVQDGPKPYWLCESCESRLSGFESPFASQVFLPICGKETSNVKYGPWMLKFAVSVSWRVALQMVDEGGNGHLNDSQKASLAEAMWRWSGFLLDQHPHPGEFEQHLIVLDELVDYTGTDVPPNINRYFLRGIEMDLVAVGPSDCFVYTKFPRFILLGFVSMKRPRRWASSKLHLNEGEISLSDHELPGGFGDYLVERCARMESTKWKISRTQWDRIQAAIRSNPDRAANSDAFLALHRDVQLSGKRRVFPPSEGTAFR